MTPILTLPITFAEAGVLAQALDLLASDPSRTAVRPWISDEWPNVAEAFGEDNDNPELAGLGYAAFDLSSRVHDLLNGASTPSWVDGLRTVMGR